MKNHSWLLKRPSHWVRLGSCDFGWSHKAAFCELWHDGDRDVVYLVKTWAVREQTPLDHAQALRAWGKLTWAWPHDGRNATLAGAGVPLMKQYADAGLEMMFEHAQFEDGSTSVEGVLQMLDRMRGGRWKVFKGDNDAWLDEFRTYHRDAKTGLIVKEADDAISASRYGMMMLRHGRTDAALARFNREIVYPNVGKF